MANTVNRMIPEEIIQIFGPPPLLSTEDPEAYDGLLRLAASQIQPTDVIGWLLVKNLADQFFEVARYRRLLAAHISAVHKRMIGDAVAAASPRRVRQELAEIFEELRNDPAYEAEVCAVPIVAEPKPPTDADFAALLPEWIGGYEQVARLLRAAEKRLSETGAEIERHHRGLGKVLRENLERTIEPEVKPQCEPKGRELIRVASPHSGGNESKVDWSALFDEEGEDARISQTTD